MKQHTVIALGFFDGVHLGHQEILRRTSALARELGAVPAALTFDIHPQRELGRKPPLLITPLEERVRLLGEHGAAEVIVVPFDREFAGTAPEHFVREMLVARYGAVGVVCGDSFRFGAGAAGRPEDIPRFSPGPALSVCPPIMQDGQVISSTLIRSLVREGRVEEACGMLGRPFTLWGEVGHGDGRGKTLGFPTLNLALSEDVLLPLNGVYATRVSIDGEERVGVTNVGVRPTFKQERSVSVETHLPDFSGSLYGQAISVAFTRFLRPEQQFDSSRALKEQITLDIRNALKERKI